MKPATTLTSPPPQTSEQITTQQIKQKSVAGAASYFMRTAILQVLGFVSVIILSAIFTPEEFGIYGIVIQIIGLLVFFSDIGLAAALVQKKDTPTRTDYVTAFTVQQLLAFLIVVICLLLVWSGIVSNRTGEVGNFILISLAISFPLAALKTIPSIQLERKLDFNTLIKPQLVEQLVFQSMLIGGALWGLGAFAYVPAVLARSVSGVATLYWLHPWLPGFGISKVSLKNLISFGLKFQLNDFIARIKDQLLLLALGLFFLPLREFGLVQWAKNLSVYPYNLTAQNILAITFPTFSRLQHDKALLKRAIEKSLFFITLIIVPILLGLATFSYPLTMLIPKYAQWQPALLSLALFSVSVIGSAITTPLTNALNAIGHIQTTLKLMVFWTVLTWTATPLMIWMYGYDGVAVAALIVAATSFLPFLAMQKVVPFSAIDQLWRQAVAGGALVLVALSAPDLWGSSWPLFFLGGTTAVLVYAGTMLLLGYTKVTLEVKSLITALLKRQ